MYRNITFSPGEYYHIYSRGVDKRPIFLNKKDYARFVKLLYLANSDESFNFTDTFGKRGQKGIDEVKRGIELVSVGAWCLMPNHFHLLVRVNLLEDSPKGESAVSAFMKKLLTGYSMYFNTRCHRKGVLFDGPFKAKHLDYDQYLKYQFTYIHLNPIGIIDTGWKEKHIADKKKAKDFLAKYEYSSYLDYSEVNRPEGKILNREMFQEYFETAIDFQNMIDEWINFTTEEML